MSQDKAYDILIVEDNPSDAELTVRSLRKQNLASRIYVAEDGAEAMEFIFCTGKFADRNFHQPPKVIFLDLKLPKVSGLQILKEVKSHPDTRLLPVVIITSSREQTDITAAYDLGANSYIVKPVDFDEFIHTINHTGLYWLKYNITPAID